MSQETIPKQNNDTEPNKTGECTQNECMQDERKQDEFSQLADQQRTSLVGEFWDFLKHNKKWWLLPIVIVLLLLGLLVLLSGTAIAPFIYPLF